MASRSARGRRTSQESSLMRTPERTRRSLSQGDDTPRPAGPGVFQSVNPSPNSGSHDANSAEHGHATKRLGFLGERLLSSSTSGSSTLRGIPGPTTSRSHSRAESANLLLSLSRDSTASPAPMAASSSHHGKVHASPSKVRADIMPPFASSPCDIPGVRDTPYRDHPFSKALREKPCRAPITSLPLLSIFPVVFSSI